MKKYNLIKIALFCFFLANTIFATDCDYPCRMPSNPPGVFGSGCLDNCEDCCYVIIYKQWPCEIGSQTVWNYFIESVELVEEGCLENCTNPPNEWELLQLVYEDFFGFIISSLQADVIVKIQTDPCWRIIYTTNLKPLRYEKCNINGCCWKMFDLDDDGNLVCIDSYNNPEVPCSTEMSCQPNCDLIDEIIFRNEKITIGQKNKIYIDQPIISPLPASNLVNIKFNSTYIGKIKIEIFDELGNLYDTIWKEKPYDTLNSTIDVSNLNSGNYFLNISTDNNASLYLGANLVVER